MGWGTSFTKEHYLSHKSFENKYQLESSISDLTSEIEYAKKKLLAMAVARPKDIVPEKDEEGSVNEPLSYIMHDFNETMEWLEESLLERNEEEQYLEVYDEQNSENKKSKTNTNEESE